MQADSGRAFHVLQCLKDAGIGVVIDGFGTGWVSLRDLARLRISSLKIDRAFIRDATEADDSRALIAAAIAMGHSLGATIVADGVVESPTMSLLAELGCDRAQGEAIAPPLATTEIERWLIDHGAASAPPTK